MKGRGSPLSTALACLCLAGAAPPIHSFLLPSSSSPSLTRGFQSKSLASSSSRDFRAYAAAGDGGSSGGATSGKGRSKVVVLGGGFGGLYTALRLAELAKPHPKALPNFDITLVDRSDSFVFLPLLYELAVGDASEDEVCPPFSRLLASTGIHFQRGEVLALDTQDKTATIRPLDDPTQVGHQSPSSASSLSLPYDRLVVALGSEPNNLLLSNDVVPGAAEYSMPFYRKEDALRLREKLRQAEAKALPSLYRIVIVGGGYSGVELAANLANRLGRDRCAVTLVDRGYAVLKNSPDQVRAEANKRLSEEGVEVFLGVDVLKVTDSAVTLAIQQQQQTPPAQREGGPPPPRSSSSSPPSPQSVVLSADLVVWTAGAGVNRAVGELAKSLAKGTRGRIETDTFLRSTSDPSIFVLGDNAAVQGQASLPSTAQVAFQQSEVAAWNLWASLLPPPFAPKPLAFRYTPLGEMLTLGSTQAAISSLQGLVQLGGPYASLIRRMVYILRMPTSRQRVVSARSWVQSRVRRMAEMIVGGGGGSEERGGGRA